MTSINQQDLAKPLETITEKGGQIILDWDNTIDIDDKNTIKPEAIEWLKAMAEADVDVSIVSGNKGSEQMLKKLKEVDSEHKDFWDDVIKNHYFHRKPGEKDSAYEEITGGDYSKAVLFDDTSANIKDWQRLAGDDALFYQPTEKDSKDNEPAYARLENVFDTLGEFAGKLDPNYKES